jgi:hypothetical protein
MEEIHFIPGKDFLRRHIVAIPPLPPRSACIDVSFNLLMTIIHTSNSENTSGADKSLGKRS